MKAESTTRSLAWLRTPLGLASVVGCVLAVVGFMLGYLLRAPLDDVNAADEQSVTGLAKVEERALTSDTTIGGNVRRGKTSDIALKAGDGDQVVTRVEVSKGDVLTSGQLIAIVSGRPVFAVRTEFPLYRNLDLGDSGDDVRELNALLSSLGKASAGSATFTQSTRDGIVQLYSSYDLEAPQSGQDDVKDAQAAYDEAESDPEVDDEARQKLQEQLESAKAKAGAQFRLSDFYFLPSGSPIVEKIAGRGSVIDSEEPVLGTVRSGESVVKARVDLSQAEKFEKGTEVTVSTTDNTVSQKTFTVKEVSKFKEASGEDDKIPPGYDVTIEAEDDFPDELQDAAAVSITLAADGSDKSIAIPLVGLREDPEGTYVLLPGADEKCRVTTGEEASGWIEISSDCVDVGDKIVVGP
jgi:hypothetical protein